MKSPRKADDEAYTAFVTAKSLWLQRVAYLLCQDWQRAGDLVQTTVTQLYAHWRRIEGIGNLDGYARRVLVHAYLSEQRTGWRRRVSLSGEVPENPDAPASVEEALDLRAALVRLPPRQRAIITLRYYCDLSVEQTAEELGCSAGTVKSQTSRALANLRRVLEPTDHAIEGERHR